MRVLHLIPSFVGGGAERQLALLAPELCRIGITTHIGFSHPGVTLEALRDIPTQTLIDGLWVKGWPMSYIEGARPLKSGQNMAGRAVTLRFVPHRPDLADDKPKGDRSAEYVAIELCGPGEVLPNFRNE